MVYFENTGTAIGPAFAAACTNPFGLADVEQNMPAPPSPTSDGDGDLDAFYGARYYENLPTYGTSAPAGAEQRMSGSQERLSMRYVSDRG